MREISLHSDIIGHSESLTTCITPAHQTISTLLSSPNILSEKQPTTAFPRQPNPIPFYISQISASYLYRWRLGHPIEETYPRCGTLTADTNVQSVSQQKPLETAGREHGRNEASATHSLDSFPFPCRSPG